MGKIYDLVTQYVTQIRNKFNYAPQENIGSHEHEPAQKLPIQQSASLFSDDLPADDITDDLRCYLAQGWGRGRRANKIVPQTICVFAKDGKDFFRVYDGISDDNLVEKKLTMMKPLSREEQKTLEGRIAERIGNSRFIKAKEKGYYLAPHSMMTMHLDDWG